MIERTYRGVAPQITITAPIIRDDGNKNLSDNYKRERRTEYATQYSTRLQSIDRELRK